MTRSNSSAPECKACNSFLPGTNKLTTTTEFLEFASSCTRCAVILKALDVLTDIRDPEFTELELERGGDLLPVGVVSIWLQSASTNAHEAGISVSRTVSEQIQHLYAFRYVRPKT